MSVVTLQSSLLRPVCVVLHNFVRERDGYTFEEALTVTGLEDVPDGQSVRGGGGLTKNNVKNKVVDCFLTDVKNINSRVHKIKKNIFVRNAISFVQ
jgi:hypothetical protein